MNSFNYGFFDEMVKLAQAGLLDIKPGRVSKKRVVEATKAVATAIPEASKAWTTLPYRFAEFAYGHFPDDPIKTKLSDPRMIKSAPIIAAGTGLAAATLPAALALGGWSATSKYDQDLEPRIKRAVEFVKKKREEASKSGHG